VATLLLGVNPESGHLIHYLGVTSLMVVRQSFTRGSGRRKGGRAVGFTVVHTIEDAPHNLLGFKADGKPITVCGS